MEVQIYNLYKLNEIINDHNISTEHNEIIINIPVEYEYVYEEQTDDGDVILSKKIIDIGNKINKKVKNIISIYFTNLIKKIY